MDINITTKQIEKLLVSHKIPNMLTEYDQNNIIILKVYYPKHILKICKLIDKKFSILNKKSIILKKDTDDFYFTNLSFKTNQKIINIRIHSILQNNWGII